MSKLTPLELQLQQYAPEIFSLYMLMKDQTQGGGGEKHLPHLIGVLLQYNQEFASGSVMISFGKGKITNIETRLRIIDNTAVKP